MKIDLNVPAEKARDFLNHFNAALRSICSDWRGEGRTADGGGHRIAIEGNFRFEVGTFALTWRIAQDSSGALNSIEVGAADNQADGPWGDAVHDLVTRVLVGIVANRQQEFIHTEILYYVGPALDGEYWFGSGVRFAPAIAEDADPTLLNAERAVRFDLKIAAVDAAHARAVGHEKALRLAARLGLLLHVGFYPELGVWVWTIDDDETRPWRSARRMHRISFRNEAWGQMPSKGSICKAGVFDQRPLEDTRSHSGLLRPPRETRALLRFLDQTATPSIRDAYDRCAVLSRVAFINGNLFPSVARAYRVAAVEAVVQTTGAFTSFSDFMRCHLDARELSDELLDYLYGSTRSGHFHTGVFPSGELLGIDIGPAIDMANWPATVQGYRGDDAIWKALSRWILSVLPASDAVQQKTARRDIP